jgi:hypothetical protein
MAKKRRNTTNPKNMVDLAKNMAMDTDMDMAPMIDTINTRFWMSMPKVDIVQENIVMEVDLMNTGEDPITAHISTDHRTISETWFTISLLVIAATLQFTLITALILTVLDLPIHTEVVTMAPIGNQNHGNNKPSVDNHGPPTEEDSPRCKPRSGTPSLYKSPFGIPHPDPLLNQLLQDSLPNHNSLGTPRLNNRLRLAGLDQDQRHKTNLLPQ